MRIWLLAVIRGVGEGKTCGRDAWEADMSELGDGEAEECEERQESRTTYKFVTFVIG